MAGVEFGSGNPGELGNPLFDRHKHGIVWEAEAVFTDFPQSIRVGENSKTLARNNTWLRVDKDEDGKVIAVTMSKKDRVDDIVHEEIAILSPSLIQSIKGICDTKIILDYQSIDDEGNTLFVDGGAVSYSRGAFKGRSFYFPSTRSLEFDSGVPLFVQEESEANRLIVRDEDDFTLQGIALPLSFNIYDRLEDIEERIRNGGHHGK
jgi:hypothetical protein